MWLIWAILDSRRERADAERSADQLALAGLVKGDETALAGLYDRHATGVYSLALRILQDVGDAEDIVQEVFTQAWRQASRYDPRRGAVAAWLLTMARTRAIDRLRARRIRTQDVIDDAVADVSDPLALPDAVLVSGEQVTRVRAALSQLPILQRAALELAYYEGLTHAEIAERLEEPLGTVKTRIRSAMIKLRDALEEAR
jgi:RNA polymerase sigma-70 factor (ECF subfamily)